MPREKPQFPGESSRIASKCLKGSDLNILADALAATQVAEENEQVQYLDLLEAFCSHGECLPGEVVDDLDEVIDEFSHAHTSKDVLAASKALRQATACLFEYLDAHMPANSPFRSAMVELASLIAAMAEFGCHKGNSDLFWTLGNHYVVKMNELLIANEKKC